jgi:hypothetical protein
LLLDDGKPDIAMSEADAVICMHWLQQPDVVLHHLGKVRRQICASREYLGQHGMLGMVDAGREPGWDFGPNVSQT